MKENRLLGWEENLNKAVPLLRESPGRTVRKVACFQLKSHIKEP